MEKVTVEWVDKVFDYMAQFFGDEWNNLFSDTRRLDMAKQVWQNGLAGLYKDEVKKGLAICRVMARNKTLPPNIMDFYLYSKGIKMPPPKEETPTIRNSVVAKASIDSMRRQLKGLQQTT